MTKWELVKRKVNKRIKTMEKRRDNKTKNGKWKIVDINCNDVGKN